MLLQLFPHVFFCSFVPFEFNNYVHMLQVFQQQKWHSLNVTGYNKIFCHSNMGRRFAQWNFNNFHGISANHTETIEFWVFRGSFDWYRCCSYFEFLFAQIFVHFAFRNGGKAFRLKSAPNWHFHKRMWKWFVPIHCRTVCASLHVIYVSSLT